MSDARSKRQKQPSHLFISFIVLSVTHRDTPYYTVYSTASVPTYLWGLGQLQKTPASTISSHRLSCVVVVKVVVVVELVAAWRARHRRAARQWRLRVGAQVEGLAHAAR